MIKMPGKRGEKKEKKKTFDKTQHVIRCPLQTWTTAVIYPPRSCCRSFTLTNLIKPFFSPFLSCFPKRRWDFRTMFVFVNDAVSLLPTPTISNSWGIFVTRNGWRCKVFWEIWGVMSLSTCDGQVLLHFSYFNSSAESPSILQNQFLYRSITN